MCWSWGEGGVGEEEGDECAASHAKMIITVQVSSTVFEVHGPRGCNVLSCMRCMCAGVPRSVVVLRGGGVKERKNKKRGKKCFFRSPPIALPRWPRSSKRRAQVSTP